jgi:soluble lytic murein transglycosylase-like protein
MASYLVMRVDFPNLGRCVLGVAMVLAVGGLSAQTRLPLAADGPPPWTDEPPVVSRWLEEGYAAQRAQAPVVAAARYCAAARFGSVEAQYRLGRLYLERSDDSGRAQGLAALALAAQRGHERAMLALGDEVSTGDLPACLFTGEVEVFALGQEPAVSLEVVERYVLGLPEHQRRYAQLIQGLAPRFDIDPRLALAIARAESNFDPRAVSPKNAQGLMQLMPETSSHFGVRNPFDPEQNVRGGLALLKALLLRFNGDVSLAAAAYNAGAGAVDRHRGVPPYAETREYVRRVLNFYRSTTHPRPSGEGVSLLDTARPQ